MRLPCGDNKEDATRHRPKRRLVARDLSCAISTVARFISGGWGVSLKFVDRLT
jgi:hypothetical protein